MKRETPYKPKNKFRKCFPSRWKKCAVCGSEYRLELMWKIKLEAFTMYLMPLTHKKTAYVCKTCVHNDIEAVDVLAYSLNDKWQEDNMIKCPPPKLRPTGTVKR